MQSGKTGSRGEKEEGIVVLWECMEAIDCEKLRGQTSFQVLFSLVILGWPI